MRIAKILAVGILALLMTGCEEFGMSVSLHPIARDDKPRFEPELLGRWQSEKDDEVLQFEKMPSGEFRLLIFEKSALEEDATTAPKERYSVQAMRLGRFVFLDLTEPRDTDRPILTMRVHVLVRLDLSENTLEPAFLSDDWLKSSIQEKRLDARHEMVGKQVVLTMPPDELRRFLDRYGWDDTIFQPEGRYLRLSK